MNLWLTGIFDFGLDCIDSDYSCRMIANNLPYYVEIDIEQGSNPFNVSVWIDDIYIGKENNEDFFNAITPKLKEEQKLFVKNNPKAKSITLYEGDAVVEINGKKYFDESKLYEVKQWANTFQ